ncbi:MAG TPA: M23 family metallopeptidase, partial [Candidatus Polarisedimenticolia bacterium]|nr:M23 family metallopeptidase [Candidatus Polarisedimenticolia bacterium]
MDKFSLIVVSDETSPVRRYELRKDLVRKSFWAAGIVAVLLLGLMIDYVRVRLDNRELDSLRTETVARRAQVAEFQSQLEAVDTRLTQLKEFERKIRIIANLPGSAAAGGADVTALAPDADEVGEGDGDVDQSFEADAPAPAPAASHRVPHPKASASVKDRVSLLRQAAEYLGEVADGQESSLAELVTALEGKHKHLASSPSIWPAKGWLTSRFGYRISPFTNRRQFHAGLDIAAAAGTEVVAPAEGVVVFAGKRGPMGNSIIIDHGYGVRTQYGHAEKLLVAKGQHVERGDRIALIGNTGRSTGPHLHYVVQVNGKTRDPLDYIFD